MPDDSAEEWRYSRIAELDLDRFSPAAGGRPAAVSDPGLLEGVLASLHGAVVVETSGDGVQVRGSHPAVRVVDLASDAGAARPEEDHLPGAVAGEPDALVSLNAAFSPRPVVVEIDRSPADPPTVVVVNRVGTVGSAVFTRLAVRLGADADASVVEVAAGADVDALVVPVTELDVADAARLRFVHVQLLGRSTWQSGLHASRVGRDATLSSAAVSLGGDYARLRTDSALAAQGGTSKLMAVYFADGSQMHDLRTVQDHRAPRSTSDLYFKGAVANRSRSVYTGLIRVEKGAAGTNAFQTNRNLVLHAGAHADSVPNLEIEDNDVRCSHASAVGPIEDDQRFYLESRGVPTDVAERLIALGFLDEVLDRLPVPAVAGPLRVALAAKLDEAERMEAELGSGVAR